MAALVGPAIVIVLDAASWALLAVSYAGAARFLRAAPPPASPAPGSTPDASLEATQAPPRGGWALIRSVPVLAGLLALTFVFYLLILAGPIGTALGGPVVAALGAGGTFLASALATLGLALITTAILARARARAARRR